MKPIVEETLDTLSEYIPKLKEASEEVAESFQSSDPSLSLTKLPQIFEGLEWVVSAIQGIKKNGFLLEIDTTVLNEHLIEIENSITNSDFVLLADLLEYEVSPILEEWSNEVVLLLNGK